MSGSIEILIISNLVICLLNSAIPTFQLIMLKIDHTLDFEITKLVIFTAFCIFRSQDVVYIQEYRTDNLPGTIERRIFDV